MSLNLKLSSHSVDTVHFLNAGDTFTGNIHFDSCLDIDDHPGAIIIQESQGNVVKASVVSKVRGRVMEYSAKGFFHVPSKKLILVPEQVDSKTVSFVCTFEGNENKATCEILQDNFSRRCGNFQLTRDYLGEH